MDDRANLAYAALPERLYVSLDGQVVYQVKRNLFTFYCVSFSRISQGGVGPFDYKIGQVEQFMAKMK